MLNSPVLTKLQNLFITNRLPHALLFIGKQEFSLELANNFSKWLLCENNRSSLASRCNCASCNLVATKNHPDFFSVDLGPEQEIKIDNIRLANEFAASTAYLAKLKILLINNLHNLNLPAANAFLKTLEDPNDYKSQMIFCLISSNYKSLPATILSRVIKINSNFTHNLTIEHNINKLHVLKLEITEDLYEHWVLAKLNFNDVINKWQKIQKQQFIDCLWFILFELIKSSVPQSLVATSNNSMVNSANSNEFIHNGSIEQYHKLLILIRKKISLQVLWLLIDSLNYINKLIILGVNINWSVFLYNFLLTSVTGENIYARRART